MLVHGKGMKEHLPSPLPIGLAEYGRSFSDSFAVFSGQRLIEVNTSYIPAKLSVSIEQGVYVYKPFLLCSQLCIGMKQMPGIEHDALVRICNPFNQSFGHFRTGKAQTGLPEILDEKNQTAILAHKELVEHFDCSINDFFIGAVIIKSKGFFNCCIGHMEYDILSSPLVSIV